MARRVNTRFLIILTTVVVVGGSVAFAVKKLMFREDPAKYLNQGKALVAERRWAEAVPVLARAAALSQRDPEPYILCGTAYEQLATKELDPRESMIRARKYYQAAVEVDPKSTAALHKLLDSYTGELAISTTPGTFQNVKETAGKILAIDANDVKAATAKHVATVRGWLGGTATDDASLAEAVTGLQAAAKADPANTEPPTYLAQAEIRRALEALRAERTDKERLANAREHLGLAVAVMEGALKGQDENVKMNLAAAQTLVTVDGIEADAAISKQYRQRADELLKRASAKATPGDRTYSELQLLVGTQLLRDNDRAGAEKVFRDLIEKAPYDPTPRLAVSRLISTDPKRRVEAIDLLTKPLASNPNATAYDVMATKGYEANALLEATSLRVDVYADTADVAQRAKLKGEIDAGVSNLIERFGESAATLKIKGKFQLLQAQPFEAIATLNKALALVNQSSGVKDYDLIYQLGRAYVETRQSGQAKPLLLQLVDRAPDFVPARVLLTQLYLGDTQATEAHAQLDALDKLVPGSADLVRLRFQAFIVEGKREQAQALFAKMPEGERMERLIKAQAALSLGDLPGATRVLEEGRRAFPKDVDFPINLAQAYAAQKQLDKAKAVVDEALAASPDSQPLQMLKARLNSGTTEEAVTSIAETIGKGTDAYTRELQLAMLEREQGHFDKAVERLNAAELAKPNDPRTAELFFQVYLAQRKFDDAARYVPTLAKANADHANGLTYRFRLLMAQEKFAEAEPVALELTTKMSEFAQSWLSYGQVQLAAGKYDEAIDKFVRAIERQNANLDAYKGIIDAYYRVGKYEDAARYIAQARKTFPTDPAIREAELQHELTYGDPSKVIPAREEALKAGRDQPDNWRALAQAYLRAAQLNAARVEGRKESDAFYTKARDLLAEATTTWPDNRDLAVLYADAGVALGDFVSIEKVLKAFAARDAWKGKSEPQFFLAELYARMNRLDDAEAALRTALATSGNAADVRQRLATVLVARGKPEDALALLPTSDPDLQIRRQRVNILSGAGRFKEAEDAVRASLVQTPDSLEMQALLGSVFLDQQRYEDALAQVKGVLDKDRKYPLALYVRGLALMRQPIPDYVSAITDLEAVSEAMAKNVDVRLALAEAYQASSDATKAMRTLQAGVNASPTNKPLNLRLLEMYVAAGQQSDVDRLLREASKAAALQQDPEWLAAEARAWAARGNYDKAADRVRAALALTPGNASLINAYIDMLIRGRNYKAAIAEADKIVQANDAWWGHRYKAIARKAMNDKPGAVTDLTAALKSADAAKDEGAAEAVFNTWASQLGVDEALAQLQPRVETGVRWKLLAASLYMGKQDYSAARQRLDSAMADFDKVSEADQKQLLRFAGSFYLSVLPTDPQKALDAYQKLLDKSPNDLSALNNMACLLAEGVTPPQMEQALKYSGRAYESLRNARRFDPLMFDTHGWMLVLSGKADAGVEILSQVVGRAPFTDAHYHLAMGYLAQQNPSVREADRQLDLALAAYEASAKNGKGDLALKAKIDAAKAKTTDSLSGKDVTVPPAAGAN